MSNTGHLAEQLKQHFGFSDFKEGQAEAVEHSLDGRDVVIVMPTGSGKSLCFQLASMLLDGVTLVISPLIALMKDQVDGLAELGLPATFINSSLTGTEMRERLQGMSNGKYKLVYVAPERFRMTSFMDALRAIPISLVAIDEAHCISQWGHDFRPDYLHLRSVLKTLSIPRIMALTATATPEVRADIVKQLGLGEGERGAPEILVHGFERPNLHLAVSQTASHKQKVSRIQSIIKKYSTGIVYCATRKQTERVHSLLRPTSPDCDFYHAGLSDDERKIAQDKFMNGETSVVVATNAFGMGVDRADLRFVIHWDIPGSIESYYQEIGRAGRDGKPSRCELLFNYADVRTQEFFIEGSNPAPQDVEAVWKVVKRACSHGPVTQTMAEWHQNISGVKSEMQVRTIMGILERAGLINREIESGQRTYTVDLAHDADIQNLTAQYPYLKEKRKADERKLAGVIRYASHRGCRHAYILNYFGEEHVPNRCEACDHCGGGSQRDTREPTEGEWETLQKILSCTVRMQGRFGRRKIVQVLRGSQDATLVERGLDQLPTFGLLKEFDDNYISAVINELIRERCLKVADGEYPVIGITERGQEVMRRRADVALEWPEPTGKKKKKKRKKTEAPDIGPGDAGLVSGLREWRRQRAQKDGVPAFVVMHDTALQAIAAAEPGSRDALLEVHGMGPARVEKYGEEILRVLSKGTKTT
ncbi:MAG: ATP-dependent DNA helicase [Verrucomicrobia bacterium]|nr:ATP-dependent DNA helicase [Verrucomicrobiota bacterium]